MSILRGPEDAWTQEMAKWEQHLVIVNGTPVQPIPFSEGGRGGAPFMAYPKAMYQADAADGGPRISGFKTVPDEGAELLAKGAGWFPRQEDAIEDVGRRHQELARAAAERANTERWMSSKAQAEAAAVDESTMQHVGEIPVTPIRKAGAKS